MLTADVQKVYRSDNHAWLFGWKNKYVFQAGPSKAMNWYDTAGAGALTGAGNRAADGDSMCGNAVMYDAVAGKILTLGGARDYAGTESTGNAHIVTIGEGGTMPSVTALTPMSYHRIFANAVVLPNGEVFVTGGQTIGNPFSDNLADLTPEMWSPTNNQFRRMLPNSIPRTYHSIALLLLDGTVLTGGGGLCGTCSTNHFDAQIYTPQYLLNADGTDRIRPVIRSISNPTVRVGRSLTLSTGSVVTTASLVRYGSVTHTVNTDQRRVPLVLTTNGTNIYSITVPSDPGIALPGYWMLFVMDSTGTPSVATTIKVTP
jgi:galactose oxidase